MQHLQNTGGDILRPKSFSLSSALRSLQFLSALQCLCGSSVFHLPYTLPSSVCNPCVCHSCENCRGVHQQFPFRNLSLTTRHDTQVLSLAGACEPAWPAASPLPASFSTFNCRLSTSSTIAALASGGGMSLSQRLDEIRTGFERPFWVANISEIFERLSYYGAFASLANYLHEKLNFPTEQTGTLAGIFGGMVWFLAIFGGAVADKLGFRRALSLAYLILAAAYF